MYGWDLRRKIIRSARREYVCVCVRFCSVHFASISGEQIITV